MHNLHFTLRLLALRLNKELQGYELSEAYSQEKDELVLGFATEEKECYIKLILTGSFSSLSFPTSLRRKTLNSVSLFEELYGLNVLEVKPISLDRSFIIRLEQDVVLLIKMHGRQSNFIVFRQGIVHALFKHQLKSDWDRSLESYVGKIDFQAAYLANDASALRKAMPILDNELAHLAMQAMKKAGGKKEDALDTFLENLNHPPVFYIRQSGDEVQFRLVGPEADDRIYDDILEALNAFTALYLSRQRFTSEKKGLEQQWLKQKKQAESYISKSKKRLEVLLNEISPEEIGHILMANLHAISPHQSTVELFDFYRNQNLVIPLKKELNPQQNAAYYYRKAKNRKIEITTLEENILNKELELEALEKKLQSLEQSENLKDIKGFKKEETSRAMGQESRPFKQFIIDGWQVWVGKSAKANDELTLHHSHKDDIWMHAKDVAGSHVLIKHQSGKKVPQHTLEKAAALAAWYSKSKNESLCAVLYTPKKYVRKAKGYGPGKVRVEREEVILVKPSDFQEISK